MEQIKLNVEGMGCQHCIDTISEALGALDGVSTVDVSLDNGTVSISADTEKAPITLIKETIEDAGYDVK